MWDSDIRWTTFQIQVTWSLQAFKLHNDGCDATWDRGIIVFVCMDRLKCLCDSHAGFSDLPTPAGRGWIIVCYTYIPTWDVTKHIPRARADNDRQDRTKRQPRSYSSVLARRIPSTRRRRRSPRHVPESPASCDRDEWVLSAVLYNLIRS